MKVCANVRCKVSHGRLFEPARADQMYCCRRCGQQARRWVRREGRNTGFTPAAHADARSDSIQPPQPPLSPGCGPIRTVELAA